MGEADLRQRNTCGILWHRLEKLQLLVWVCQDVAAIAEELEVTEATVAVRRLAKHCWGCCVMML